jgi:inosine-uridine nucleoside N-ribohydrolase
MLAFKGHDDAMAILLACNLDNLHLLGVSTVHGNADAECTRNNAARCLYAFAGRSDVQVCAVTTLLNPTECVSLKGVHWGHQTSDPAGTCKLSLLQLVDIGLIMEHSARS